MWSYDCFKQSCGFTPSWELHRLGGCECGCAISQHLHGKWWHFESFFKSSSCSTAVAEGGWNRLQRPGWSTGAILGLTAELPSARHFATIKTKHLHTLHFLNNLPSPGFPHVSGAAQPRDLPVLPSGCLTIGSESITLPQLWSSSRQRATRRSGISLISSNNGLLVHSWFSYDFNGTAFPVGFFCMEEAWSQRTFVAGKIWRGCRYAFLILEVSFSLFRGEHHCQ